jgi:hypothetical protein
LKISAKEEESRLFQSPAEFIRKAAEEGHRHPERGTEAVCKTRGPMKIPITIPYEVFVSADRLAQRINSVH